LLPPQLCARIEADLLCVLAGTSTTAAASEGGALTIEKQKAANFFAVSG